MTRVSASSALNAYVLETPEKAMEMAAGDKKIASVRRGLWKVCRLVKDLFCTKGVRKPRVPIFWATSPRLMKAG